MDALSLRNQLQMLLDGQIGHYTLSNGQRVLAIAVLPDPEVRYAYPPPGTAIEGLEVVIMQPFAQFTPLLGNQGMQPATWEIRLKRWEGAQGNLIEIANTLIPQLAKAIDATFANPGYLLPKPEKGIVEQAIIQFTVYGHAT